MVSFALVLLLAATPVPGTQARKGHLVARPATPVEQGKVGWVLDLPADVAPDAKLLVPESLKPDQPAALIVMLHGAGRTQQE